MTKQSEIFAASSTHPLSPLTESEIDQFRSIIEEAGLLGDSKRVTYLHLLEPSPSAVKAWRDGEVIARRLSALLLDLATARSVEVVVDLSAGEVVHSAEVDALTGGQAPILDEEYVLADEIVKADPAWCEAILKRGVPSVDLVRTAPLSAGVFGYEDEIGVRMCRVHSFVQTEDLEQIWAHPVSGVVAHVDLTNRKVLRVIEANEMPMPTANQDWNNPDYRGPERTDLKPIHITQPEGVSFTLEDNLLKWQNWSVRIGFNGREGLTLHQVSFNDRGEERSIMHRASISEMVVPYGEAAPSHSWQNYFDAGEYQYGRLANSLTLGCDCVGEIAYVDAVVADDFGKPLRIPNAICIHEEDYGTLWKHSDMFAETVDVRRQRRLVISFFTTVGNYDYGFYWYLYLDGKIQLETKATGVLFPANHDGGDETYATVVADGIGAPFHQHMFSARLHMAIDGDRMNVDEIEAQAIPIGPENPVGSAFTRKITRLTSESDAQRLADNSVGRVWRISSAERTNSVKRPTSYVLYPEGQPALMAAEGASIRDRARFATKHLWVTPFADGEYWAAGERPNQHPGGAGLPAYTAEDRSVENADVVVWHTFGMTHFPRTEDWPIMPVDYCGFTMKPFGFFDRSPVIDVPQLADGASCHAGVGNGTGGCNCGHRGGDCHCSHDESTASHADH